jgi:hypothetical protein
MGFAAGCGAEEHTPTADVASRAAKPSASDPSPETKTPLGESQKISVSVADPSEAQMPELLVPIPRASAMDAEVRPAAALSLPATDFSKVTVSSAFSELVEAYRTGQADQWSRAEATIHAHASVALPALWEGLKSSDRPTRELASMMLAQVLPNLLYGENASHPPDATQWAENLRQALTDESAEVRVNVAVALSLMEGEGQGLIPVLEELLTSELPHVRTMAVSALGNLGPAASNAIGAIEQMSQTDSDSTAKAAAIEALNQLRRVQ